MAVRQLMFRVFAMTAVCLAALLAPVSAIDRIVILTAAGLGIGCAAVLPGYDRLATRIVGPAVLILALVPPSGLWALVDVLALFSIGFASFDRDGMVRIAPALGLPIATVAFRAGVPVDPVLLGGWLIATVVTVGLANAAWPVAPGYPLGPADGGDQPARPVVFGWRRAVQGTLVVALVVPIAFVASTFVERAVPTFVLAQPQAGDAAGPRLLAHPGLTGGLDVGSPVNLSDDVVLRVAADRPLYWRGTTYDLWDGRRWTSTVEHREISWSGSGVRLPQPPQQSAADLPDPVAVLQRFKSERAGLDVVLGAWQIDAVWSTERQGMLGDDGSVRLETPFGAGATWTVESTMVPASPDDLRRADPLGLAATPAELIPLANEDDVTPEVVALAQSITADATTTYDKVKALEDWMDDNIDYTRSIPRLPEGSDAVHHLLFESQQGYCEQIGSALVVMLRSLGIPSRLVVGYVPGEYASASGEWLSRGTDAHAWAEVYFPGVGWQGFDPTAGVPALPEGSPARAPGGVPMAALAMAAVAVAASGGVFYRFRTVLGRWRGGASRPSVPAHLVPVVELQCRFDAIGERFELDWSASTTVREKSRDLVALGLDRDLVGPVADALERLWFQDLASPGSGGLPDRVSNEMAAEVERLALALASLERSIPSGAPLRGREAAPL